MSKLTRKETFAGTRFAKVFLEFAAVVFETCLCVKACFSEVFVVVQKRGTTFKSGRKLTKTRVTFYWVGVEVSLFHQNRSRVEQRVEL